MMPEGVYVRIQVMGDGRSAVVEKATGEPVQYVVDVVTAPKLLVRWDAVFESAWQRARMAS